MQRWLTAILILLAGATAAPAHELLDRVDACRARLDADLDVGYERVAARCPQLVADLGRSTWAAWLPADWNQPRNQLSAEGLGELRTLLARSLSPPARAYAPSAQKAAAVVARISQADPRQGWWPRFRAWLRGLTAGREPDSDPLGRWWASMDISHRAAQLLAWCALALVMAIALGILVNELRVAGVLRARGAALRRAAPRGGAGQLDRDLRDLERHDLREQPGLLLQLIADRLTAQGRLPPARALTTRELLRDARLADESERGALTELAESCERLRFSALHAAGGGLAAVIAAARRVLARIEAPAAPHA